MSIFYLKNFKNDEKALFLQIPSEVHCSFNVTLIYCAFQAIRVDDMKGMQKPNHNCC